MTACGSNVEYYDRLARYYGLFFGDFRRSMDDEERWLSDVLAGRCGRRALDASCGTGRQAIPLARLGYDVTGADPSRAMLTIAQEHAAESGVRVRFLQSCFAELPERISGQFDLVVSMGNALCHVQSHEEIGAALAALRRCCCDDGACLIGVKDFDRILLARPDHQRPRGSRTADEPAALFERWEYDDPMLVVTVTVVRKNVEAVGSRRWSALQAATREYMLTERELREHCDRAGFRAVTRLAHPGEAAYLLTV